MENTPTPSPFLHTIPLAPVDQLTSSPSQSNLNSSRIPRLSSLRRSSTPNSVPSDSHMLLPPALPRRRPSSPAVLHRRSTNVRFPSRPISALSHRSSISTIQSVDDLSTTPPTPRPTVRRSQSKAEIGHGFPPVKSMIRRWESRPEKEQDLLNEKGKENVDVDVEERGRGTVRGVKRGREKSVESRASGKR